MRHPHRARPHRPLEELAYGARLPLDLDVRLTERLSERVEAAAYTSSSPEALTNLPKHARGSAVRIQVQRTNGGPSSRSPTTGSADRGRGTGLRGLADRVDALGGRLRVESRRGRGTIVRARRRVA